MTDSILNIKVSGFAHCKSTTPADVTLLSWLTTDKYRDKVERIRSIQDEDLQKTIKKSLPAITPSGRFSYRDEAHLTEHTGFIAFDIDFQDNRHITNFTELKKEVSHIVTVAYCGLSVRGRGFWGLVPIPVSTPEVHKKRFETLAGDFREFGIILDPAGSDVCRLRIASWDPDAYFNHSAKLYTKITEPKSQPRPAFARPASGSDKELTEAIIREARERRIDMTTTYKGEWFTLSAALANTFGELGRGYFHDLSRIYSKYNFREADKMFSDCLRRKYERITIDRFYEIAAQHGIYPQGPVITEDPVPLSIVDKPMPDPWGVADLEKFFSAKELPTDPVKLNDWTTITDVRLFTETHLATVKAHNGAERYAPYYERLRDLKIILS